MQLNKTTETGLTILKECWLLNIQGLISQQKDKINLLREMMCNERPLFLALTETWLHSHKDAEVNISGYNLFRKDRPLRKTFGRGRHVGGVALYIQSSWMTDAKEILAYSNAVVDILAIHSKNENTIIAIVYRQPENNKCTQNIYRSTYKDFEVPLNKLREAILKHKDPETEIKFMGDFNMPSADWDMNTVVEGTAEDQRKLITTTQDFCESFLLQQIITTATHQKGNTLDLVFTNTPENIHSHFTLNTAISDHHLVVFLKKHRESQQSKKILVLVNQII